MTVTHDGLSATWGRGVVREIRETLGTWWIKEMTNPNLKTVAVSFFLYLACVAPAITFGAIYAKLVGNWMGATETLLATAWTGICYALIGGMPIMINGGTGPVLAFTAVLYDVSKTLDVPFLTFRAWIGMWVCVYMVLAAIVDLNRFMHLATRFTDDCFSLLISVIFIVNALGSPTSSVGIFHYFDEWHPSHDEYRPERTSNGTDPAAGKWDDPDYSHLAAALLSTVGCLGTTWLALRLRGFKQSPFFPGPRWRTVVADFAVVASVATFTCIDRLAFKEVRSETLAAPSELAPTFQCCTSMCNASWPDDCPEVGAAYGARPWVVDFGDLNGKHWVPLFAALPAILAFILLFLDNGITWHLINRKENGLTHGQSYNYDTIIIGLAILVNSIFGLPWLCAATVRSVNHLNALAERDASGKIVSVQQTRLTHLGIHVLVLITLFSMQILRQIPMSVLYGVFLYMGIAALTGNQFYERILMAFMQKDKYPARPYTSGRISRRTLFGFTAVQLVAFGLMYAVKTIKSVAIAFPLIIAACIPVRLYLLPRLFDKEALLLLDGDEEEIRAALAKKRDDAEAAQADPAEGVTSEPSDKMASQPASSPISVLSATQDKAPDAFPVSAGGVAPAEVQVEVIKQ